MTEKKCENCKYYQDYNCIKGNLETDNIIFLDGEYRVKCYDWKGKV